MEYYKITSQLVKYVDCIFLWSAYSHIRILMEDMGLGVHRGVILYVPNHNQAEMVIRNFELCGAVRGRIQGHKLPSALNSKIVIVDCQAHNKKEYIYEFLNNSDYFPILIVAGKFPKWIHQDNYPNLLFVETLDDCAELEVEFGKNQAAILKKFMEFSHDHTELLAKFLSSIKQRAWFKGIADRRQIYKALFCIGKVFEFHVQMACTGMDLPDDFNDYLNGIICESLDFEDYEMNTVSDFYKALVQYLDCKNRFLLDQLMQFKEI